ncbi:uncharacterized protein METZ01_LOCUS392919, partial [marine metagenome]
MKLSLWLCAIIVIDLAFFPMFHVMGIPVKPSYLLLFLAIAWGLQGGYIHLDRTCKNLTLLFLGLAGAISLGQIIFLTFYGGENSGETLRLASICILAPVALIAGYQITPGRHRYLIYLPFIYFAATLVVSIFLKSLPFVVAFYGLEYQDYFAYRSPGLF